MRISPVVVYALGGLCLVGVVVAVLHGEVAAAAAFGGGATAMAYVGSTTRGPRPHSAWSPSLVQPGRAVVFWKDGCPYCHRLLRALGTDPRVTWVNVYRDKGGDAEVRSLNDGDQLTPTAIVGECVLRNPSPQELLAALG